MMFFAATEIEILRWVFWGGMGFLGICFLLSLIGAIIGIWVNIRDS